MQSKFIEIIKFIREKFNTPEGVIFLHEPRFNGNEKKNMLLIVLTLLLFQAWVNMLPVLKK